MMVTLRSFQDRIKAVILLYFLAVRKSDGVEALAREGNGSPSSACPSDLVECGHTGQCVSPSWVCDGAADCYGGEDETGCGVGGGRPGGVVAASSGCTSDWQFQCSAGLCLSVSWVCDGERDCKDGSDELPRNCKAVAEKLRKLTGKQDSLPCSLNEQKCTNENRCILQRQFCDGVNDCSDGEDESFCYGLLCPSGLCKQKCRIAHDFKDHVCYCDDASIPSGSTGLCKDLDECNPDWKERYCDQRCINTNSGFACKCDDGYSPSYNSSQRHRYCVPEAVLSETDPLMKASGGRPILLLQTTGPQQVGAGSLDWRTGIIDGDRDGDVGAKASIAVGRLSHVPLQQIKFSEGKLCYINSSDAGVMGSPRSILCQSVTAGSTLSHVTLAEGRISILPKYSMLFVVSAAVDWMSGNWYMIDELRSIIFICNSPSGDVCRVIIAPSSSTQRFSELAVDPRMNRLFYTDLGSTPSISSSSLDGSSSKVIVGKRVYRARGLTLDFPNRILFWFDEFTAQVYRSTYDGTAITLLRTGSQERHIMSIALSGSHLYVASTARNHSVYTVMRHSTNRFDSSLPVNMTYGRYLRGMTLYHSTRQPVVQNYPCAQSNGNCSQICVPDPTNQAAALCLCEEGKELASDRVTCIDSLNVDDIALLYSDAKQRMIKSIEVEKPLGSLPTALLAPSPNIEESEVTLPPAIFPVVDAGIPVSVDYDYKTDSLFYVDISRNRIGQRFLKQSSSEKTYLSSASHIPEGVCIDSLTRTIYWVERGITRIMSARLDDPQINNTVWTNTRTRRNTPSGPASTRAPETIITTFSAQSTSNSITVDMTGGRLYWTVYSSGAEGGKEFPSPSSSSPPVKSSPPTSPMSTQSPGSATYHTPPPKPQSLYGQIWTIRTGGSDLGKLHLTGPGADVVWPNGLTVTQRTAGTEAQRRLYWCDAYLNRVSFAILPSSNSTVDEALYAQILLEAPVVQFPYGLAITGSRLFWTADKGVSIHSLDTANPRVSSSPSVPASTPSLSPSSPSLPRPPSLSPRIPTGSNTTLLDVLVRTSMPIHGLLVVDRKAWRSLTLTSPCAEECSDMCVSGEEGEFKCVCGVGRKEVSTEGGKVTTCEVDLSYTPATSCPAGLFECMNGRCINPAWLCDGSDDCGDKSDELAHLACPEKRCPTSTSSCTNSPFTCLKQAWFCDGDDDCPDGEDELNCGTPKPCKTLHMCPGAPGRPAHCIQQHWLCDNEEDCLDGSDERNCSLNCIPPLSFLCDNGRCKYGDLVCDGDDDCGDGSDEINCKRCDPEQFLVCESDKRCLSKRYHCDGHEDCADGSDERACDNAPTKCREGYVQCGNSTECILYNWKCDQEHDCTDMSDELGCDPDFTCHKELDFQCAASKKCIPRSWRCDGEVDCHTGKEDEEGCVPKCTNQEFLCTLKSTGKPECLDVSKLCDDVEDCTGGEDESEYCKVRFCELSPCTDSCYNDPNGGYRCACPEGKRLLESDNITCTEVDHCGQWGACSQGCLNTRAGKKCYCHDGYSLAPDQFSCRPKDRENAKVEIIFSNRQEIRLLGVEPGSERRVIMSNLRNAIALGFHYSLHLFYWTDVLEDRIYRGTLGASGTLALVEPIVDVGLPTAEGLAVDWVAGNLYWVESYLDVIEVARLDGTNRGTLIAGDLHHPRALALDPRVGLLFWSDWGTKTISHASMTGSDRKTIFDVSTVPGAGWCNGLTLDYDQSRVYWIDARSDSIHSITYEGTDERLILSNHAFMAHPFSISVFGNYVYWSDWKTTSINRANKWHGGDSSQVEKTASKPFDLKVYHPFRQPPLAPDAHNPCATAAKESSGKPGGNCSHLCLLGKEGTYACACPHLMVIGQDKRTCQDLDQFLLISSETDIRGVKLDDPDFVVMSTYHTAVVKQPMNVDYFIEGAGTKMLFWADNSQMEINSGRMEGTPSQSRKDNTGSTITYVDNGQKKSGFAIDWSAPNIYFASRKGSSIVGDTKGSAVVEVAKLDGAARKVIIEPGHYDSITQMVVLPSFGKMYLYDDIRKLLSCHLLDGRYSSKVSLPVSDNATVEGLTAVEDLGLLYWTNGTHLIIHNITSNELVSDDHVLTKSEQPITALTVLGNTVYYFSNGVIYSYDLITGKVHEFLTGLKKVKDLKIVQKRPGLGRGGCGENYGGCAQLCLPWGGGPGQFTCACTGGYQLADDNKNCTGFDSFLMYISGGRISGILLSNTSDQEQTIPSPPDSDAFSGPECPSPVSATPALAQISEVGSPVAVDFYAQDDRIIWMDNRQRAIRSVQRDLKGRRTLVEGLSDGRDLAIDWVARHLYWIDAGYGTVEVCALDDALSGAEDGDGRVIDGSEMTTGRGSKAACRSLVLIHEDLYSPSTLILNPVKGTMYWVSKVYRPRLAASRWAATSSTGFPDPWVTAIERANLDGTNRTTIIEYRTIHSVAIDYSAELLFYCNSDKDKVMGIELDGSGEFMFMGRPNMTDCISLTVHEGRIYFADSANGKIKFAPTRRGPVEHVSCLRQSDIVHPIDLQYYDRSLQQGTNPCAVNNGGCEEFCFYRGLSQQTVCRCMHGKVGPDGKKCVAHESLLAYSAVQRIYFLNPEEGQTPNDPRPPIEEKAVMRNVIALAYSKALRRLYFSDFFQGAIYWTEIEEKKTGNGTSADYVIEPLVSGVGSVEGLAVETQLQDLYFTSNTDSTINRVNLHASKRSAERLVTLAPEDRPRAIALDSCNGYMYWTNWNEERPSIQRALLDGYGVTSIITTNISVPNGLSIDHRTQQLYWADAHLDKIERCSLNGTRRIIILENVPHVFALTVLDDYIYYTDWVSWNVKMANKFDGSGLTVLVESKQLDRRPRSIVGIGPEADNCTLNPCYQKRMNGDCMYGCHVDPETHEAKCQCPPGFTVSTAKGGCSDPLSKLCPSSQFPCVTHLRSVCLSYELTCDGINHCVAEDGSAFDEDPTWCRDRKCPSDVYFQCASNSRCIPVTRRCNGLVECSDGSDERSCNCTALQYKCGDSTCIDLGRKCDGTRDCSDGTDEYGCGKEVDCTRFEHPFYGLLLDGLPCPHGSHCILKNWICDGQDDCGDQSDEKDCPVTTCKPTEWACGSSRTVWPPLGSPPRHECIPSTFRCDRDVDCNDGSDEIGCGPIPPGGEGCGGDPTQFACSLHGECVALAWRCDGHNDCPDSSDEANCTGSGFPGGHTPRRCHNETEISCLSGECISRDLFCDGEVHCRDGTDELTYVCLDIPCDPGERACDNGVCLPDSFICDGIDDCGDGSDEPITCKYERCDPSVHFPCSVPRPHACVPLSARCNGTAECGDDSDESEEACLAATGGAGGHRPGGACGRGIGGAAASDVSLWECRHSKECILSSHLCDGVRHCHDFSDELGCGLDECNEMNGGCAQLCTDDPVGFHCSCFHGYKLSSNNRSCDDINECEALMPCSQWCFNTPGSYKCACNHNYKLTSDKKGCRATVAPHPKLLVANRYFIRVLDLNGTTDRLLARDFTNAVALDYDWSEHQIYWSDVGAAGLSRISRMNMNGTHKEVLHSSGLKSPDGLAVDWLGRNLYWCDASLSTIEVSTLSGQHRKVLVHSGLISNPRSIQILPSRGYLFYSDWGRKPHIGRLGMDAGEDPIPIVKVPDVAWPNGLTIDPETEKLFFGDAKHDVVGVCDLDGSNLRKLRVSPGDVPHIFALATFEDWIFWTDWVKKKVLRARKFSGKDVTALEEFTHRPMDIKVLHPLRQKETVNPCAAKDCQAMCLIKAGGKAAVCACPENHNLAPDGVSCISDCERSEFQCLGEPKCIPFYEVCDGSDNCEDGSDEKDCHLGGGTSASCSAGSVYNCPADPKCIRASQICDGTADCSDSHDEMVFANCSHYKCPFGTMKCQTSLHHFKCLPNHLRCDGHVHCPFDKEDENCPEVYNCSADQFLCADTHSCVARVFICDGEPDCRDGSDESLAVCHPPVPPTGPPVCPLTHFHRCNVSGKCIPKTWVCDRRMDCGPNDTSDEPPSCDKPRCSEDSFVCTNGKCIPGHWRCNWLNDCGDNSDEIGCESRNCSSPHTFQCHSGDQCVTLPDRCDGFDDCLDGSDELHCTPGGGTPPSGDLCPHGFSLCGPDMTGTKVPAATPHSRSSRSLITDPGVVSTQRCVPSEWICDGSPDCPDGSDEMNCRTSCSTDKFRCNNTLCVPKAFVCDSFDDCRDGSDEDGRCAETKCLPGRFRCSNNKCVSKQLVCDKRNDCGDNSDELHCPTEPKSCTVDEFMCGEPVRKSGGAKLKGAAQGTCIHKSKVCDGTSDCADKSDEMSERFVCSKVEGGCKAIKLSLEFYFATECRTKCEDVKPNVVNHTCPERGYVMKDLGHPCSCVDENECLNFGTCPQFCENMAGGYNCQCQPHFSPKWSHGSVARLFGVGKLQCVAVGPRPALLLPTGTGMWALPLDKTNASPVNLLGSEERSRRRRSGEDTAEQRGRRFYAVDVLSLGDEGDVIVFAIERSAGLSPRIVSFVLNSTVMHGASTSVKRNPAADGVPRKGAPIQEFSKYIAGTPANPTIVTDGLQDPQDLAVDWIHNIVYWTDGETRSVYAAPIGIGSHSSDVMDSSSRGALGAVQVQVERTTTGADTTGGQPTSWHRMTVAQPNSRDTPSGVAVDPVVLRRVYWTAEGATPRVWSSNLDGSQARVLTTSVQWPRGIALDVSNSRVYWADAKDRTVVSARADDGTDLHVIRRFEADINGTVITPELVDVFEHSVFVTVSNVGGTGNGVVEINKFGTLGEGHIGHVDIEPASVGSYLERDLPWRVRGLIVAHPQKQFKSSDSDPCAVIDGRAPCGSGAVCVSALRVKSPSYVPVLEKTCVCPDGYNTTKTDNCIPHCDCKNGGNCTTLVSGPPFCACTDGFTGVRCELQPCRGYCGAAGKCKLVNNNPICKCPIWAAGPQCRQSPCDVLNCTTYGTCATDSGGATFCRCLHTHKGKRCELEASKTPCGLCQNGAACRGAVRGEPSCECLPGFTGFYCEKCDLGYGREESCAAGDGICRRGHPTLGSSNPGPLYCDCRYINLDPKSNCTQSRCQCKNGARCHVEASPRGGEPIIHCECREAYTGDLCDEPVDCLSGKLCGKHGRCRKLGWWGHVSCVCIHGYSGRSCNIPPKCSNDVCVNGGTCFVNQKGGVECSCSGSFSGHRCEIAPDLTGSKVNQSTVTGAVAGSLVFLAICALLGAMFFFIRKRRDRQKQFHHLMMGEEDEAANMEVRNPMFDGGKDGGGRGDDSDDEDGGTEMSTFFTPSGSNFANPVFGMDGQDTDKNKLLRND